jgi:hypothetical protein
MTALERSKRRHSSSMPLQLLGNGVCRPGAGEAVVNKGWLQNSA